MEFDIFFSISQTPDHNGFTPSESEMFANYYAQLEAADRLGFGVAWIAQAHWNMGCGSSLREKREPRVGSSRDYGPHHSGH